jgi:DDE family transposase
VRRYATDPLFAWARLEDHPQRATLRPLLEILPDQQLLDGLEQARGRGRHDFPVPVLWGVVVVTVALRHTSFRGCLDELRRNPALYRLLGLRTVAGIPHDGNVCRFVEVLGGEPHLSELRKVFDVLARHRGRAVPDLGEQLAGDSTGLSARSGKHQPEEVEQGLPQPSGGKKEYTDEAGKVVKVVEWFGYKLHLLVDGRHEVPLAYRVTDTKAADPDLIGPLLEQARAKLPPERRRRTLASDKAADNEEVPERLQREGIKPLIQNRALGRDEPERPLPGGPGR